MHEIMDRTGEPKIGRVYPRNSGDQHWSHYLRQTALFYDEFAQRAPTPGVSDELELIPLVSCNHFPLVGAAIADKGLSFNSKFVFMCSNRGDISPGTGLTSANAFRRRRHVCVEVSKDDNLPFRPTEPYYNQFFQLKDPMKPRDNLVYTDEDGNRIAYGPMSYAQLILYTSERAKEHFEREAESLKFTRRAEGYYREPIGDEFGFAEQGSSEILKPALVIPANQIVAASMPHLSNPGCLAHQIHGTYKGKPFCCDGVTGERCKVELTGQEQALIKSLELDVHPYAYTVALATSLNATER